MNGHLAWLAFTDLPGVIGAGDTDIRDVVREEKRVVMNTWMFWLMIAWGVLGTIGTVWGAWLTWGGEVSEEASE